MTITSRRRIRRASTLGGLLIATALAGCGQDLPTSNPTDIGTVGVFVSDQHGNGIPFAEVHVTVPGPGGNFTDSQPTDSAEEIGHTTFQGVPAGTSQIWVDAPAGYTGGGITANEMTITIVTDQTTSVTLSLTKSSG